MVFENQGVDFTVRLQRVQGNLNAVVGGQIPQYSPIITPSSL